MDRPGVVEEIRCRDGGDAAGEGDDVEVHRRAKEHPNSCIGTDFAALHRFLFPSGRS